VHAVAAADAWNRPGAHGAHAPDELLLLLLVLLA
jgi:hypothetical protein